MMLENDIRIQEAAKDLKYLLDRGYKRGGALNYVSNHHNLDEACRNYLLRYVFSDEEIASHRSKLMPIEGIRGRDVIIDTYNVIITVEAILSGAQTVKGMDGFTRDNSAVFSGYQYSERTVQALEKVLGVLAASGPASVLFILDSPISKSGELAALIRTRMEEYGMNGDARTTDTADYEIKTIGGITASTDSVIIESVPNAIDVASEILAGVVI